MDTDKEQALASGDRQVVIFRLAEGSYAIDIAAVREIIRPQALTTVPQAPPCVVGVINLRSSIVPVLDLRRRCGLPPINATRDSRVVVVQVGDQSVGLQVERCDVIREGLARAGVHAWRLDTPALRQLYYRRLCPRTAHLQSFDHGHGGSAATARVLFAQVTDDATQNGEDDEESDEEDDRA